LSIFLLLVSIESVAQVSDLVVPVALGPWASSEVKALGDVAGRTQRLENFWQRVREMKTPVIERDPADKGSILVTFVTRAPAGYSYPVPAVHGTYGWHGLYRLESVPSTDIWMKTIRFPSTTRTGYWLTSPRGRVSDPEAIDVFSVFADPSTPAQEVYLDPLSRHAAPYFSTATGNVSRYSWFEGPDAPPEPFLAPQSGVPRGTVTTRVAKSVLLGNARDISIYTPPGYRKEGARDYPLLLIFDRDEYLATVQVPSLLDAMIHARAVPPVVAVFVDVIGYAERGRELPGDPTFQRFIREELLPPLEREFGLTSDPARRVVAGCSYGGLAATLIARRYPESFGAVVSQSGAFSRVPASALPNGAGPPENYGEVARLFAEAPRLPIRFSLDVGLLERGGMIGSNRHMRDVLLAKGYAVDYSEFMGAHDWIGWRGSLPGRLAAVLGSAGRSNASP
jgi:enterochelin esterase family protein